MHLADQLTIRKNALKWQVRKVDITPHRGAQRVVVLRQDLRFSERHQPLTGLSGVRIEQVPAPPGLGSLRENVLGITGGERPYARQRTLKRFPHALRLTTP